MCLFALGLPLEGAAQAQLTLQPSDRLYIVLQTLAPGVWQPWMGDSLSRLSSQLPFSTEVRFPIAQRADHLDRTTQYMEDSLHLWRKDIQWVEGYAELRRKFNTYAGGEFRYVRKPFQRDSMLLFAGPLKEIDKLAHTLSFAGLAFKPEIKQYKSPATPTNGAILRLGPTQVVVHDYHRGLLAALNQKGVLAKLKMPKYEELKSTALQEAKREIQKTGYSMLYDSASFPMSIEGVTLCSDTLVIQVNIGILVKIGWTDQGVPITYMGGKQHLFTQYYDQTLLHLPRPYLASYMLPSRSSSSIWQNRTLFLPAYTDEEQRWAGIATWQADVANDSSAWATPDLRIPKPAHIPKPMAYGSEAVTGTAFTFPEHIYYPSPFSTPLTALAAPTTLPDSAWPQVVQPFGVGHLSLYQQEGQALVLALHTRDGKHVVNSTAVPRRKDYTPDGPLTILSATLYDTRVGVLWNDGQVFVYSLAAPAPSPKPPPRTKKPFTIYENGKTRVVYPH